MQSLATRQFKKANIILSHSGRGNHSSRTKETALPYATNRPTRNRQQGRDPAMTRQINLSHLSRVYHTSAKLRVAHPLSYLTITTIL